MSRLTERFHEDGLCYGKVDCEDNCTYCNRFLKVLNKLCDYEDAEEQGLLVKVECHCKDCVHWSDMVAGATEHVKLCTVGGYMTGMNGFCVYAEQKLESMKGE